ncbi:hypothetical protein Barb4_01867 [Bacteroidales bacterium Barb4]|nr:hypothetical protein Barb4_01867 [Bacteroidales bacterium Barb4]
MWGLRHPSAFAGKISACIARRVNASVKISFQFFSVYGEKVYLSAIF